MCFPHQDHAASVTTNLPDDIHGALQKRAERRGQSLQHYLTNELTRLAERPTPEVAIERDGVRRRLQIVTADWQWISRGRRLSTGCSLERKLGADRRRFKRHRAVHRVIDRPGFVDTPAGTACDLDQVAAVDQ